MAEDDQIIITSSVAVAIEIIARAVCRPDAPIGLETPGDPQLGARLDMSRLAHVPVKVDREGLVLPRQPLGAVVTSAALHAPTGATLSSARADALAGWSRDQASWIVERDCLGHLAFDGAKPRSPLRARIVERTLYVRGLDRLTYPGIGLAFILAPRELVPALTEQRCRVDGRLGRLDQLVLARFITEGGLAAHLRALRPALREREAGLRRVLAPFVGRAVGEPVSGGATLFVPAGALPPAALCAALSAAGLPSRALSEFGQAGGVEGVVIPFADLSPAEIEQLHDPVGAMLAAESV